LPPAGTATAAGGFHSREQWFTASVFNSSTAAAVLQNFVWQAEPAANNTAAPGGTLNLLYSSATGTPAETGLKIAKNGQITFAAGQTFPTVTGNETVTGDLTASELISTVATGTAPLNVTSTTEVANLNASLLGGKAASAFAQLAAANTFTGNQTVNGNLSATGVVTGSGFQIGSNLFAFGSFSTGNAFLGFAGNTKTTGELNTAVGGSALFDNTTGLSNTAVGVGALYDNTTGSSNTAVGAGTLGSTSASSQTGSYNTATGNSALAGNTTGNSNTATGYQALYSLGSLGPTGTGSYNTASGYQALYSNSAGNYNAASGYAALWLNTGGFNNAANGPLALWRNTTGNSNTASGYSALQANTTGNLNTAIGVLAGTTINLTDITGSNNTFLGANSEMWGNLNYATALGACSLVSASNALVLGANLGACGSSNPTANTNVGIDVSNPSNILTVLQGGGPAIADSWSTYSSRRWKTNIHPLQNALGKVEQLRGVSYDLKDSGKHEIGVIAEEVGQVVPEVVTYEENGKDARGVDYSRLTALLIEAVKLQQKQIATQQSQIRKQQRLTRAQQVEISTQRQLMSTQQKQIAGLSRKIGVLESSLRTGQPNKLTVLALK
jgi:trimeric autotransporter adhesin